MGSFGSFAADIRVATAGIEPDQIARLLAQRARAELSAAIQSGRASPQYERIVNGRRGAIEESVVPPGPIVYVFANWRLVIDATLAELRKRQPRAVTGAFDRSWIVLVNGRPVTSYEGIPGNAEVAITNVQPYVRKAEAGKLGVPRRRLFDGTKRAMSRRFTGMDSAAPFDFEVRYLSLGSGIHPLVPYVLKGGGPRVRAAQNGRSSAFRAGREFLVRRRDREAGAALTYPAIIIRPL